MMPFISFLIFIFIFGTLVGSFLNVCIYRLPREESIVFPRSRCPSCYRTLGFFDLIPIFSHLFLKGRCRYCGGKISPFYSLVEALTGIIFLLVVFNFGLSLSALALVVFSSLLIVIFFIDLKHKIIPNTLTYPGIVFGLGVSLLPPPLLVKFLDSLFALILGGGFFLLIAFVSRGGMGGGDIKLAGMMGAYLGCKDLILALFLSFALGALAGLFLILLKVKSRKDYLPFGPSLVVGTFLVLFWGEELWQWYCQMSGLRF